MIATLWLALIAFICLAGLTVLTLVRLSGKRSKLTFYHPAFVIWGWDFRPKFHFIRMIFLIWMEFSAVGAFLYWAYAPADTPNYDATLALGLSSVIIFALWASIVFPCYWGWRDLGVFFAFLGLLLSAGTAIAATIDASTENDVRLWIAMGFFWVFFLGWFFPLLLSIQHKWNDVPHVNFVHLSAHICKNAMGYSESGNRLYYLMGHY